MDESVKVLRKKHLNRGTKGKQKSAKRERDSGKDRACKVSKTRKVWGIKGTKELVQWEHSGVKS